VGGSPAGAVRRIRQPVRVRPASLPNAGRRGVEGERISQVEALFFAVCAARSFFDQVANKWSVM
jgi:hypothetical protein